MRNLFARQRKVQVGGINQVNEYHAIEKRITEGVDDIVSSSNSYVRIRRQLNESVFLILQKYFTSSITYLTILLFELA